MVHNVAAHCGFTAFIFVPNLCNAACSFCYVQPTFAARARASSVVLSRAAVAAEALATLGFKEVRFTGGEPTLFSNLDEIIQPFLDKGLRYRVLTNALSVDQHLSFFAGRVPDRFTVSVHDTANPDAVFGVPISADAWAQNRRKLAAICDVEATLVIQNVSSGWERVERTISDLETDGVSDLKIILENSRQGLDELSFDLMARAFSKKWAKHFRTFRFTDIRQRSCRLPQKSFPAIDLGRSAIFACCVQVGDKMVPSSYSVELPSHAASAVTELTSLIERSRGTAPERRPCEAGTSFCPLGLAQ